ncbi:MAG: type II secretion system protein GspM [Polaromonas sp.]|uniref:type II secretion system protein GspM n=1 Tax=Polaromonas sp. TaxID=1869339 RepID=UPI00273565CC|nr:type II secretion system protein GspM [Polaromonas sp.]MDP2818742.1 type II secretion system protein GspM [Polaromonas sp.]
MTIATALSPLRGRWAAAHPREQRLVRSAVVLVGLALVWWLLVAPPLRTLSQGPTEQGSLEVQGQKMQNLRVQALALQAVRKVSHDEALRALDAAVRQQFGASAQLSVLGDSATVSLRNAPADALAQWLPLARVNARALPSEVRLMRTNTTPPGQAVWSGTIVMRLPPQ